jgi:hypothetical protein
MQEYRDSGLDSSADSILFSDLPKLKFWEGDIVKAVFKETMHIPEHIPIWEGEGLLSIIRDISYHNIASTRSDGSPYPFYQITSNEGQCYSQAICESELTLVKRGNIWKHYHNEPIVFNNIEDEIKLAAQLGKVHEVRNPVNG